MNETEDTALSVLIEQQRTALDLLIKKQLEITELAFKIYPGDREEHYKTIKALINMNDSIYKMRRNYLSDLDTLADLKLIQRIEEDLNRVKILIDYIEQKNLRHR